MNHKTVDAMMARIAPVIREFCVKAIADIGTRIKALEDRVPLKGDPGPAGKDAEPVDPAAVKALVAEAVAALPAAKDGAPGPAGKDAEPVDPATVRALVAEAVAALPPAKDGAPGPAGKDAEPVDPATVKALVAEAVAALPPAKNGEKGDPGRDGRDASDLGIIKEMVPDRVRTEVVAILKQATLSSDDDGRTFKFSLPLGDDVVLHEIKTALVIDCGVWRERPDGYVKGDGATWDGSFWIAQGATKAQPGTRESGWRLAVKSGRNGTNGKDGRPGPAGPKGEPGRDGRSF